VFTDARTVKVLSKDYIFIEDSFGQFAVHYANNMTLAEAKFDFFAENLK